LPAASTSHQLAARINFAAIRGESDTAIHPDTLLFVQL